MSEFYLDTDPAAEAFLLDRLRQAPARRKLALVGQLNAAVHTLARAGLRQRHPDADPEELDRRLADLLLGPDLAARVYGSLSEGSAVDDR